MGQNRTKQTVSMKQNQTKQTVSMKQNQAKQTVSMKQNQAKQTISMGQNRTKQTVSMEQNQAKQAKTQRSRLNKIRVVVPDEPDLLRHVTQLDVRDNGLEELDISLFPCLEVLHCERNHIATLKAKGSMLKAAIPEWLCEIKKLEVLDLSHNLVTELPARSSADVLLDGNCLSELPSELGSLQRLGYLGLLPHVPQVLERLTSMERLCMAGNSLDTLVLQSFRLLRFKHVDLRLNKIRVVVPDEPDLLRHVTQLDVRDNGLEELDISLFPCLEVLHCERNHIATLKAKGSMLKAAIPEWLCEIKKLEVLDLSHNLVTELPA
ncbi:unnamed protein product, partial [Coregonus sp. 'balchen']